MAASHHHQQNHHMNNIHRSSATAANTAYVMSEEEEEEDLAALRIAALKTLEERKLKKEPRALIVQRNNVLVIEPQDSVNDFRHSPPVRRFSRERSSSPILHRRRSRETTPTLRKISPPSSRWSPRANTHRRSPSPYHMNGGHHSPSHHPWNSNKRRSSPRRLSHSPRRRSPLRRRSPPPSRRSPHRLQLSPSRRSPQRSPARRSSPQRSPPSRRSPRKSPVRGSPRRFSPRRRLQDSSRQSKSTGRNGEKRRASPPAPSSSSSSTISGRRRTISPRRKESTVHSPDPKETADVVPPSTKKGRFERFEDSAATDDESCNESLLDELFRETEETTARTEALEGESLDGDSQEQTGVAVEAEEDKVEDEDCLLLQADDDLDDLLVDCSAPEVAAVSVNQPTEDSGATESKRGGQEKIFKERDLDEKNRSRGRHNDHRSESSSEAAPRNRHGRSERTARIERKENRERKTKVPKDDHKAELNTEKRKRSRSREKDRSKRKPSRKTSLKPERHMSDPKPETRPQSHVSKSRTQSSPEKSISNEDRERLEARKKKFLQKELKPSQKVISLKKSPTSRTEETDDVRRVQDRLGEPLKESKRSSPRSDDAVETSSKPTILSRLGPPPASRASIKDRIGHINTNSLSPTRTSSTGTDAAQVKFEVRNRPTLDPKLKIHINLGGTLSTGSSGGSSKSKKVVCLE